MRAALLASECPGFFSAGDDLGSMQDIDESLIALLPKAHAVLNEFEQLPIPTVAAINGHALGGGLELALVCDFRFMAQCDIRIGLPEVRLGLIPSLGGTQRLPMTAGKAKAIEMMFKGLQLTPDDAMEIGLVNKLTPEDEIFDYSFNFAKRLALQATHAIAMIKASLYTGLYKGFEKGIEREMEAFKENIFTPDAREGVDAFFQGRKPEFKGTKS